MQLRRQLGRRDRKLLGPIKAPSVDRPDFTPNAELAAFFVQRRLQVRVEPDEIKRGTDPGNACDQVKPAQ